MYNPFENDQGSFVVLVNEENQYSLWPVVIAIPEGWGKEYGPEEKSNCLEYIENHWQDMRPKSLLEAMDSVMT